jgi:hypothetical protein
VIDGALFKIAAAIENGCFDVDAACACAVTPLDRFDRERAYATAGIDSHHRLFFIAVSLRHSLSSRVISACRKNPFCFYQIMCPADTLSSIFFFIQKQALIILSRKSGAGELWRATDNGAT